MWGIDWDAPLSKDDRDALIETVAREVHKRGMTIPAILFLEMHKPLGFVAGQTLVFGSGFLAPLVGAQNLQKWAKLIENPDDVERLIRRIESPPSSSAAPPEPQIAGAATERQA
jgi:hypothetical protein